MPAFLAPLLIRFALDVLIRLGVITGFDAALVRGGTHVLTAIKSVKTYSNNDQLDQSKSDFPSQIHSGGV